MLRLREVVGSNPTVSIEEFHRFFDVLEYFSDEKGEDEGVMDVFTPVADTITSDADSTLRQCEIFGE